MNCPTDEQLAQLAYGRLDGPQLVAVERHLDGCRDCRQLLAVVSAGSAPLTQPERAALQAGERLGRYEIERLIAAGGMGMLYVARDTQLGRRVALKLMRPAFGGDVGRMRLLREAQAMAALSHPNVVHVYELGEVDGRVFVAMELVEGGTLRDAMKQSGTTWRQVVDLFIAAGRGLHAAHVSGVVHRDFKPENVLVGKDGRPRVTDFGLSRPGMVAAEEPPPNAAITRVTATGAMLGTPAYMSPEQLAGRPADARSDQYSFCVCLYEALVGKRPFPADTLEELRARVTGGMPPPPKDGLVPEHVWAAIARGLQPDPSRRFPDMEALLTMLSFEGAARPRRRTAGIVAAVVTALLVAVAGGATFVMTRPPAVTALGSQPLTLGVGLVRLVDLPNVERLAVGDPSIAEVKSIAGQQIAISGRALGRTTLRVWANGVLTETPIEVTNEDFISSDTTVVELNQRFAQREFYLPNVTGVLGLDPRVATLQTLLHGNGHNTLTLTGLRPGRTNLFVWTQDGKRHEYFIRMKDSPDLGGEVTGPPFRLPPGLEKRPEHQLGTQLVMRSGSQRVVKVPGLERVVVGNWSVLEVRRLGPDTLLLTARMSTATTLVVWINGELREIPVQVGDDAPLGAATQTLELSPGEQKVLEARDVIGLVVGSTYVVDAKQLGSDRIQLSAIEVGQSTVLAWTKDDVLTWAVRVVKARPASDLPGERVALQVGKSRSFAIPNVMRVAIGDSDIADAKVGGDGSLIVDGVSEGETTLLVWTANGKRISSVIDVKAR